MKLDRIFILPLLVLLSKVVCVQSNPCPTFKGLQCGGRGYCDLTVCVCFEGFDGGDCSRRICATGRSWGATTGSPHREEAECSDRGHCVAGKCECERGFGGGACELTKCAHACGRYGICRLNVTTGVDTWDADKVRYCDCDSGYYGPSCTLRRAPLGFDPLMDARDLQDEVQLFSCAGAITTPQSWLQFDWLRSSVRCALASLNPLVDLTNALRSLRGLHDVVVSLSEPHGLICGPDQIVSITFRNYLTLTSLPPIGIRTSLPTTSVVLVSGGGVYEGVSSISVSRFATPCSSRGLADSITGECVCFRNYGHQGLANCDHAFSPHSFCPGTMACNGKGVCSFSPTFHCECSQGWQGADCSQRACPSAYSWIPGNHGSRVECGGFGSCNRGSGKCMCASGYEGAACERRKPPSQVKAPSQHEEHCSGNGVAVTIGDVWPGYGKEFTKRLGEFDASRVILCSCADGFHSYDCSRRTCPLGLDPEGLDNGEPAQFPCSRRGICDDSVESGGICRCFTGFMGPNCGVKRAYMYSTRSP